jgi:hypothetical protein
MAVSLPSARLLGRIDGLPSGVVELWLVDLDVTPDGVRGLLSLDERARGARIASERRRVRWERSRGALRALLAIRLDADPAALRFARGPHGKPALAVGARVHGASAQARYPRFNMSHSHGLMLVALSATGEVGVDIERVRARHTPGFLRTWTLREARVKCLGTGLGATPAREGGAELARVRCTEIDVGPAVVAALAWLDHPCASQRSAFAS